MFENPLSEVTYGYDLFTRVLSNLNDKISRTNYCLNMIFDFMSIFYMSEENYTG